MITLDTSALYTVVNRLDPHHDRTHRVLQEDPGPSIVPAATLGEIAYLIEQRLQLEVLYRFVADIQTGAYQLDCGDRDFSRVDELVRRYADLPLGLVDAAVIACAERNGGRVLTLDYRHFGVVAREGRITLLP